ncbi:flagellar basal body-associated FliL family protein [Wenzhouxiangella sp. AB-CW3]|uniref:flagellar basal body-associated FliL family protein n=1 Tax=Wenzhouxiangella sp. AB-CW3 TaxID=2771012 RepID=UPI00168BEAFC|nr:flagellar basal body-associated FliL family protein [Wenzhouxiangella sp. AB-CW3]QOC21198.1 flagellar basal body-associated FliL family protein [Wenzhouxiangella sp. AB-CW3]
MAESQNETPAVKESGGIMKILLISMVVGLFMSAIVAGTLFFVLSDDLLGDDENGDAEATEEVRPSGPPIYHEFDPPFIANLKDSGTVRFLQVTVQVMARDRKIIEAVSEHEPVIRNNLLMLFSDQTRESIREREAREALREAAREEIREILRDQDAPDDVEQVYFTSFVLQ